MSDELEHADLVICPGGPLLVRGKRRIQAEDGTVHATRGPVSAVCRCGFSGRLPWCDGTHKALPEDKRP